MTDDDVTRPTTPQAIARLYEETGHLVHRRCMQMLHDTHEAMDATQWVFLRAIEVDLELRTPGEDLMWLYRTATRRCLWVMRNRRNRGRIRAQHADDLRGAPAPSAEERTIHRDVLRRVLERVDDEVAEVALLCWVQGLSVDRAAEVTGVSKRTVIRRRKAFEAELRALWAQREGA